MKSLTSSEYKELKRHGISSARAEEQLRALKKGFSFAKLARPATLNDGIWKLSPPEQKFAEQKFLELMHRKNILKFVPASGAASRMFQFLEDQDPKYGESKKKFLDNLPRLAFYDALARAAKRNGQDLKVLRKQKNLAAIAALLLNSDGLGYRLEPKGGILFHGKGKKARTAFEEQLAEAVELLGKSPSVHFTLPIPKRRELRRFLKQTSKKYSAKIKLTDSVQEPATDHLALEKNGRPVKDGAGHLLLRPSGHGALLGNLNQICADAIFVKNIDNILPRQNRKEADRWKRILGGVFFETQFKVFEAQRILKQSKMTPAELLFVLKTAALLGAPRTALRDRHLLSLFLNRPLRICGMVPNSGEPGGGPFWVESGRGASLQIIESAEVNLKNPGQNKIWQQSTHFNPVDFICGVCDHRGKKYNLHQFKDPSRGMIAEKNYSGRTIKVMELPGLWNGSMADWITVFVEVPASTFAPVKTVLDLLRKEHQVEK